VTVAVEVAVATDFAGVVAVTAGAGMEVVDVVEVVVELVLATTVDLVSGTLAAAEENEWPF
jgi:hypothetical protein